MVFGDYLNDIEMMQEANFSFAMANAHRHIKELANYSNDNNGVTKVIAQVLNAF